MSRAASVAAEIVALVGVALMMSIPFGYGLDPLAAPRVAAVFGPAVLGLGGMIDPEAPRRLLARFRVLPRAR